MAETELSGGVRSGLCGGHCNGLGDIHEMWPIQHLGKWSFKISWTAKVKWVGCQLTAATALMLITSPQWLHMWQHEQAYPKKMGQLSNLLAHTHSITCGGALLCQKYIFHAVTVIGVTLTSVKNLWAEFGCVIMIHGSAVHIIAVIAAVLYEVCWLNVWLLRICSKLTHFVCVCVWSEWLLSCSGSNIWLSYTKHSCQVVTIAAWYNGGPWSQSCLAYQLSWFMLILDGLSVPRQMLRWYLKWGYNCFFLHCAFNCSPIFIQSELSKTNNPLALSLWLCKTASFAARIVILTGLSGRIWGGTLVGQVIPGVLKDHVVCMFSSLALEDEDTLILWNIRKHPTTQCPVPEDLNNCPLVFEVKNILWFKALLCVGF